MRHHDAFDRWSVLLSAHELGATVFLWNTRMLVSFRMVPNNVSMPDKTHTVDCESNSTGLHCGEHNRNGTIQFGQGT